MQFWDVREFPADYGDGTAVFLSVCVSEWNTPGILYGKAARECTREEVVHEARAQCKDALNDTGKAVLNVDADLHSWCIDPAVTGLGGHTPRNREQLLVHPTGTL
ncbi:hypothetical protein [Kitasatospora atroaurantiaca]|uniref:hypothetical protein n=1 Tax=Kitasatospora atroaurantiaca TaxID=285545 RepID=UPI001BA7C2AC